MTGGKATRTDSKVSSLHENFRLLKLPSITMLLSMGLTCGFSGGRSLPGRAF